MEKTLVAYFSASGVTAKLAANLCEVLNADLLEIEPEQKYTQEDLDWRNPNSRSSVEMKDFTIFPPMKKTVASLNDYSTIYLGFPIWWGTAPTMIHTFLKAYDMENKNIVVFATSGGSGLGKTVENIQVYAPKATFIPTTILNANMSKEELMNFVQSL